MLRPGLCWLHVLDVAGPLLADAYFVYIHTLGVRKRKRTVACTMVSAYLWVCTVKYKSVYTRIHGCPTRFVRKRPPCLRKYHLAEKYSPVNTRSTFIRTTTWKVFSHWTFPLLFVRAHSGSVLRNEFLFFSFFLSFFLSFFSFVKRPFFYCIVLSRWELIVEEKFAFFSFFFVFFFSCPPRFCAKLSPVIGDEEGWLHLRIVEKYLFYRRIRYFENNRKRCFAFWIWRITNVFLF